MALLGLLPQAEGYLDLLLKEYTEDRGRWPLWTYERRQPVLGRSNSWYGKPWIDRIYWSSLLPMLTVVKDVDAAVKAKGGTLLSFSVTHPTVAWLRIARRPQGDDPGRRARTR